MYKIFVSIVLLFCINMAQAQLTYIVNSTSVSGAGTLPDAINTANASLATQASPFVITFALPAGSVLPGMGYVSKPVIIDASSNTSAAYTGTPVLTLQSHFSGIPAGFSIGAEGSILKGFILTGTGGGSTVAINCSSVQILQCTVSGGVTGISIADNCNNVTINSCSISGTDDGINANNTTNLIIKGCTIGKNIDKGIWLNAVSTNFQILNNKIGTDGTTVLGQLDGIFIQDNPVSGTIANNTISGNTNDGIYVAPGTAGAVLITGNYIGTDLTGAISIPNGYGIFLDRCSGMVPTIGGAGVGNVISGNNFDGVFSFLSPAIIKGNTIGMNSGGTQALPNRYGIFVQYVSAATGCQIGGTLPGEGNIIGGHTLTTSVPNPAGIFVQGSSNTIIVGNKIGTDVSGNNAVPNLNGIYIQQNQNSRITGNIISGNTGYGIQINEENNPVLKGNKIGVNVAGAQALGNGLDGINIGQSENITIGGSNAGDGNIISGNQNGLVSVSGNSTISILGNLIGTDYTGNKAIPNNSNGIYVNYTAGIIIGSLSTGTGNVISGNLGSGIFLDAGANFATIQNNNIGVSLSGSLLSNAADGITLRPGGGGEGGGDPSLIDNNIISGNGQMGIDYQTTSGSAIIISNNYIGTNKAYASIGNKLQGVMISGNNGTTVISANVIGNNGGQGVLLINSNDNQISGNYIGTNASGDILTNQGDGIKLYGSSHSVIGVTNGTTVLGHGGVILAGIEDAVTGISNVIAYNKGNGILVDSGAFNILSGNVIHDNGGAANKSINLNFADTNPNSVGNNGKAIPLFTSFSSSSGSYIISGTSTGNQDGIQFFVGDATGKYAMKYLAGYDVFVSFNNNNLTWTVTIPVNLIPGGVIVATATDNNGENTSELNSAKISDTISDPKFCAQCVTSFSPVPKQKYLLSAWVLEEYSGAAPANYTNSGIIISFNDSSIVLPIMQGSGPIIEGWQRIEQSFTVPANAYNIQIKLVNLNPATTATATTATMDVYFDDIRIHPFRSNTKSYVYDPGTQRLTAELDENNYATRYEYDDEGILIRVKKETERGLMTIKEIRNNQSKINTKGQ